jgi:hypothetical protein
METIVFFVMRIKSLKELLNLPNSRQQLKPDVTRLKWQQNLKFINLFMMMSRKITMVPERQRIERRNTPQNVTRPYLKIMRNIYLQRYILNILI